MTVRDDVREAIESACSVEMAEGRPDRHSRRFRGYHKVRATVLSVVQELPSDMTLGELVDELQIAENQGGEE